MRMTTNERHMKQQSAQHDTTRLDCPSGPPRHCSRLCRTVAGGSDRQTGATDGPENRKTGKLVLGDGVDPSIDFLPPRSGWRAAIVGGSNRDKGGDSAWQVTGLTGKSGNVVTLVVR
jgi:hypothetical protein